MSLREALRNALRNLAAHKLRSALTMLGMLFGVAAVIAMLAIGAGAERRALDMIEQLGLRNVLLRAKELKAEEVAELRKKSPGLAPRDALAVEQALSDVELAAPRVLFEPPRVTATTGKSKAKVWGVSHRTAELFGLALAEGRFLDAVDEREHAQVCVVGPEVRRELFGYGPALGQHLKVVDVWLEVVGVLAGGGQGASSFQGVAIGSTARDVLMPVTTALRKLERDSSKSPLDEIVVRLKPEASPQAAGTLIRALVDRLHTGVEDYDVVVPELLLEQSRRTQRLFAVVMGCIAGISLLVGGIGIMNIMLATVLERTREIGVRRAVGATRKEIRNQFVSEAAMISVLGGLAGVLMGVLIAWVVAATAGWPTVVTALSILLSFGVSLAVGLASGIYPAVRAARLDPIEALRYE